MPVIFRHEYDPKLIPGGGHMEITPTVKSFVEADDSDVRLDRVRIFDEHGAFVRSYLRDKMGRRFEDNLENTEDDLSYLETLPFLQK